MHAFDPNDYRKRVLAAVERRGGIDQSDPFELYDIPLDEAETLSDAEVSARVSEVWGFWQRQRDHPKYRVLVGLLVENHDQLSYLLLDASARRAEAIRIRHEREQRDAERYEMLDTAISRLVQRHGGVPAAKVPGLEEIGAMGGLSATEVAARLRRHRIIQDAPQSTAPAVTSTLTDQRRQQIRGLLAEWGRLVDGPPAPTLLGLLGLDPSRATHTGEIRLRADALRARSRELPPGRMRVVLDELLIHVQDLLEPGGSVVAEYVASIVEDVTAELRPKVRAAVLVEDELVGEDYEFLLDEAIALGMDPHAAGRLLEDLAVELGSRAVGSARPTPAPFPSSTGRAATPAAPAPPRRQWEEPLKAARAALRGGRPQEAARHIAEARGLDPHNEGTTPIRSVSDDVERVLADAARHWRVALAARAAARYVEALEHLRQLRRVAADVPPPTGSIAGLDELLAEAERAVAEADRLVAAAAAGPSAERSRTLRAAQAACVDHPGASEALAATPVPAPGRVTATRMANGSVQVVWSPAPADDVAYRVTRLQPDGSWRVVGRTRGTELEDGGAPPGEVPVYAVAAATSGSYSEAIRSDAAPEPRRSPTASMDLPGRAAQPLPAAEPASADRSAGSADSASAMPPGPVVQPAAAGQSAPVDSHDEATVPAAPPGTTMPQGSVVRPVSASGPAPADESGQAAHAVPAARSGSIDRHARNDSGPEVLPDSSGPSRQAVPHDAVDRSGSVTEQEAAVRQDADGLPGSVVEPGAVADSGSVPRPGSTAQREPSPDSAAPSGAQSGSFGGVPGESAGFRAGAATGSGVDPTAAVVPDDPMPSGIPVVTDLGERAGLLTFMWPTGVTEVMVVARPDRAPVAPDEPEARAWKVTNMRYEIDGGVRVPPDLPRPCHIAVASCRREPNGKLTVAAGFAPGARIHWTHA
ncbi:Ig-like domain repeat protein [Nocardia bhagyanarayanae]|uniref:SaeA fourth Fn3-like domain-containing protein n=1 Tax=Nocardia bhagyanarayanae TaxID=1215925 RepID=A0A543FCI6_9NOCA|nr:Ig-like domain repeat protein [Nocardia bhagyanarayanae]TQM31547.1 hypothetical protein FB390_3206 [Nocardia bhagyanarayanae]